MAKTRNEAEVQRTRCVRGIGGVGDGVGEIAVRSGVTRSFILARMENPWCPSRRGCPSSFLGAGNRCDRNVTKLDWPHLLAGFAVTLRALKAPQFHVGRRSPVARPDAQAQWN